MLQCKCIMVTLCINISCPWSRKIYPPQSSYQDDQDNSIIEIPRFKQYFSILFPLLYSHQNTNRGWICYSISLVDSLKYRLLSPESRNTGKKKKKESSGWRNYKEHGGGCVWRDTEALEIMRLQCFALT